MNRDDGRRFLEERLTELKAFNPNRHRIRDGNRDITDEVVALIDRHIREIEAILASPDEGMRTDELNASNDG